MYGGFARTTSQPSAAAATPSPSRSSTSSPSRSAFSRASATASRETSIPVTSASARSSFNASAIAPDPTPTSRIRGRQRLGELVELALEDPVELVNRELDPVVREPVLGEVVGADFLRALAGTNLRVAGRVELRSLPLELPLVEARAQHAHRLLPVLQLRLLVLHRDDDPSRKVRDADGGVGRIDGLASRPGRTVDVNLELVWIDLDLDLLRLGHHRDGRGGRVDPARAFGLGHPLDAVRPALRLQHGVRAVTLDREGRLR